MNNKYNLIILCGKAGAGKDYLLQKICELYPEKVHPVISDTTRPTRWGEENGVNYNFLTEKEFFVKDHIEQSYFNNWYYGTPVDSLSTDKINIAVMNSSGIRQVYNREDLNIKVFYISAMDKIRILRQLNREKYPNVPEICRRFLADEEDFQDLYKYPTRKLRNIDEHDLKQCIAIIKETIDELLADSDKMN